ncbi:MAG TPA: rhodanese-like domain-containing protein, partial [Spirochaetia bacterium]
MRVTLAFALVLGTVGISASLGAGLERKAEAGGVTGVATPTNIDDAAASTIDFKVGLDTHSVPLGFDMRSIAVLSDGSGETESPISWTGGKGGHHLSGVLSFTAAGLRTSRALVLTLSGAGGGKDLVFRWDGPFGAVPARAGSSVGTWTNITPSQLSAMMKSKDFFLANTHVPYAGEIAGTDAFIPFDQTAARLGEYPTDKNARVVLYCRSGRMSEEAARALVQAGYTNVENLV